MIKCPKCYSDNVHGAKYCSSCGVKLKVELVCPTCGKTIIEGAKFCSYCGKEIVDAKESIVEDCETSTHKASTAIQKRNNHDKIKGIGSIIVFILIGGMVAFLCFTHINSDKWFGNADNSISATVDTVFNDTVIENANMEKYYGDGATFDVRGKVKTITYNDGITYSFDNRCFLITDDDNLDMVEVIRNSDGKIRKFEYGPHHGGIYAKYEYLQNGQIKKETVKKGSAINCSIIYGGHDYSQGLEASVQPNYSENSIKSYTATFKHYTDEDEGRYINPGQPYVITKPKESKTTIKIEIISTDSKGNWTERRLEGEIIVLDDEGFEHVGYYTEYDDSLDELILSKDKVYYAKKKVSKTEKRKITYYGESSPSTSSNSSSSINSSSSNTSSNSKYSQREQELLEENKRLCNEWTRYDNALTKAMNEFDYNYKHGYSVVQSFGDMQFCVNKLDEIADGLSRIDSRTGSIFKDKVKKYKDGLEYCKVHSGYYR